jgi:hypothetical protein
MDEGGCGFCYILLGVSPASAYAARKLAPSGAAFVILERDRTVGRGLTLALNAGTPGYALYLPGDPSDPDDCALAIQEASLLGPQRSCIIWRSP